MSYRTIKLKKYLDIVEEYAAHEAMYPGTLVELISTDKVRKHATAQGNVLPMFALEDELQGNGIDDAFAANDKVQVFVPQRGEMVYAILKDGENVAIGDFLESAGGGLLQKHVADTWASNNTGTIYAGSIVAQAIEALDLSGSSGTETPDSVLGYNKRIAVRIV